MKITINQTDSLELEHNLSGTRIVKFQGREYEQLTDLIQEFPELSHPQHIQQFAIIVNYMLTGDLYVVMDSNDEIQKYKNSYSKYLDIIPEYGTYNLDPIKPPTTQNNQAIFYAYRDDTNVPYCVTCTYPFLGQTSCNYTLLERINGAYNVPSQ